MNGDPYQLFSSFRVESIADNSPFISLPHFLNIFEMQMSVGFCLVLIYGTLKSWLVKSKTSLACIRGFNVVFFFCWHPPKTIDFKDAAGTLYLKEYISFFSIQCCFPVFTLLGKLPSAKCKMDYLIIKIFQVYERVWDQ